MKKEFFDAMMPIMKENKNVYLLFIGLGYPRVDEFLSMFPDRAINTEASEQTALDMAVGLAYEGKIPVVYTITPFLYRGFETIRTYIAYENLNVKLIGAGRNDDYSKTDGHTHDAGDVRGVMGLFPNIKQYWPETKDEIPAIVKKMIENDRPSFVSLRR